MIAYAYNNHDLISHLKNTKDRALRYLEVVNANVICKRFSKLGLKITVEELKEVVRLTALLHDIGKASDVYQKEPYANFYLHELPSAYLAYRVLGNEEKLTQEHKDLIVITVLQHMSSMRDWLDEIAPEIRYKEWSFNKCFDYVNSFLICEFGYKINLTVYKADVLGLIKKYQDMSRDSSWRWLKLYNLILALISAADSIDAYTARKDNLDPNRRWFIEELMKLEY